MVPDVEYVTVVVISSGEASKFDITSASMELISESLRELVTVVVTSNVATDPVLEGILLGMLVVGAKTGCDVGFADKNTERH